jgi:putative oxygen-independent coproporphyrinogen III oxidase
MTSIPFGLYIHWPFCLSKCPYCDFNSHVRSQVDQNRFREALRSEMRWMANWMQGHADLNAPDTELNIGPDSRPGTTPGTAPGTAPGTFHLKSIFFGGGTPSLMAPQTVQALIQEALSLWPAEKDLEITLEANPTSVEAEKFAGFREGGVNRLSLGIQSLRAEQLAFLGRHHTPSQSHQALHLASTLFPRFSFDLIYALPTQTPAAWKEELEEALRLYKPRHLSLYQLTYEPGTPFYTRFQRGDLKEPEEETAVELFEITQQLTQRQGLEAYEISNYAQPGEASIHNLGYWRGRPYVGIGPGAHGRLKEGHQTWALQTHKMPEKWLAQVEATGQGVSETTLLAPEQRFLELFSMGLRLYEGLSLAHIQDETGSPFESWIDSAALAHLKAQGFLAQTPEKISLTAAGRLRLNAILAYCLKR